MRFELRNQEPVSRITGEPFVLESFLTDLSYIVDRYPTDHRFADYLLCGVLAEKDAKTFNNIFNILARSLYPGGDQIPVLYQEALLLLANKDPEIVQKYKIDKEVLERFNDFTDLRRNGKAAQAKRKYAGTYWAYVY